MQKGVDTMNKQPLNFGQTLLLATLIGLSFLLLLGGAARASAATASPPTLPIPGDAPPAPPPIPNLPAAGQAPPAADQIADPVTAGASCSGWYLQSSYGDRWAAGPIWWEYKCNFDISQSGGDPCAGGGGACNAWCEYCYTETQDWTDYFYWDGSEPTFYGQVYTDSIDSNFFGSSESVNWWDAPTAQWYNLGPFPLTVSTAGAGAGSVGVSPGGLSCTSSCQPSFDSGTVVTLTASPDPGSTFSGWTGDCSGTGTCQQTMSQAHSVTATFVRSNFGLVVSKQGTGTGLVTSSPAGISCGTTCQSTLTSGSTVTLSATPNPGSVFAGWSGDCSGTGSCQLTMSQARSVTATFAPNLPPNASFTLTCTSLTCNFDASGSSDPDDAIVNYAWSFGDGTSASGLTVSHTYPKAGVYTATLTVTDNAGASTVTSKTFNPISVSARGYKQNGAEKIDLSWNTPAGTTYDIYRNNTKIANLQGSAYTDTVTGRGTFTYKVCASSASICSNQTSVSF
jgi:PKD repeat protein